MAAVLPSVVVVVLLCIGIIALVAAGILYARCKWKRARSVVLGENAVPMAWCRSPPVGVC